MVDQVEIKIEKLIGGGHGMAHLPDGKVVMAPMVIPGEHVRVHIVCNKKKYLEGNVVKLLTASPLRITPKCPHFGDCGGCDWQHIDYPAQVAFKEEILQEHFLRAAVIGVEDLAEIRLPALASPSPFNYRQRLRMKIDALGRLGFFKVRSHTVVPVESCPLARAELNGLLEIINASAAMDHLLQNSREIELILSPDNKKIFINLLFSRKPRAADIAQARSFSSENHEVVLYLSPEDHVRSGPFSSDVQNGGSTEFVNFTLPVSDAANGKLRMSYEAGGFCQVNLDQNASLVRTMLEWLADTKPTRALDLFCGMGNFSLPLAASGWEVVGMDLQGSAIRSAERNSGINTLSGCRFEKISALQGIEKLVSNNEEFELLVLDPPRAGCIDVIPHIAKIRAANILYISCDPATLSRDLKELIGLGYTIKKMRLVDMFPQTHHMETIVLLEKA